jgi:U3 small nucleolar RNA-associated protein 22
MAIMPAPKTEKRKAAVQAGQPKKVRYPESCWKAPAERSQKIAARRPPSPSPEAGDAGFEDFEDGEGGSEEGNMPNIYDDPMIDAPGSSGSEDEEEDGDLSQGDEDEDAGSLVDDEPNEFADDSTPQAGPSRTRPAGKSLYAPPTVEEMDRLRTAQETGNTFTLQLEALLSSTILPSLPHPALKSLLSAVHDFILSLPSLPGVSPKAAVQRIGEIPFPGGTEWSPLKGEVQWTLGWEKPGEVIVGGSWGVCGGYKKGKGEMGGIDLAVVMPTVRRLSSG